MQSDLDCYRRDPFMKRPFDQRPQGATEVEEDAHNKKKKKNWEVQRFWDWNIFSNSLEKKSDAYEVL